MLIRSAILRRRRFFFTTMMLRGDWRFGIGEMSRKIGFGIFPEMTVMPRRFPPDVDRFRWERRSTMQFPLTESKAWRRFRSLPLKETADLRSLSVFVSIRKTLIVSKRS